MNFSDWVHININKNIIKWQSKPIIFPTTFFLSNTFTFPSITINFNYLIFGLSTFSVLLHPNNQAYSQIQIHFFTEGFSIWDFPAPLQLLKTSIGGIEIQDLKIGIVINQKF